ncbi:FK506-binding protein 5 isoform X2 [Camponotus floridanus]|uniref:FK506-binding protein 5 isoform X2 n=1 Tax=Camponotus floridanus TaxID=104421 RepID=UPI00059C27C3|nr:FK506-binding protein 5 isoform X2 [Camponotus floridanus]
MDGGTPRPVVISNPQATTVVCNLMTTTSPRLTPTGKISHAKTRVYTQRYRKEWEQMQDFKGWLTSVPHQPTRAYCNYCKKNLHAHRLSLLKHTCTMKHQRAALTYKEEKKNSRKWDANALEVGLTEEVEAVDDPQSEGDEENEEDNDDFVVETLDIDEEEEIEIQDVKEEAEEIIDDEEIMDDEEETEKEIVTDLYTQLQSDDEEMKPVAKKTKLSNQKCRDTLAEAMAHVHNEYLEEEVEDQGDVQMEMIVESANPDIPVLSDAADNAKETLKENEKMEIRSDMKSTILEDIKSDLIVTSTGLLPVLDTTYTNISSTPPQNINLLPIAPNLKNNKTITLMCGNKTFTLTGGTFQPGTQYVLTKLKGKPLMMADQKKTIAISESNKIKKTSPPISTSQSPTVPSTSQQPIISTNQQSTVASIKGLSSKKVVLGKQPIKSTTTKKLRISTYVVDNTKGIPVSGLQVSLYKLMDGKWTFLNESNTNAEGYCVDLMEKVNCTIGRYKIHFDVDKYFTLRRIETMYPFVEIVFDVKNPNGHYHMPLLLSPFGYSTYRGT